MVREGGASMAVDLTVSPWNRLARLAPPETTGDQLQDAATRYALNADVYSAAADLWEEAALLIGTEPSATDTNIPVDIDGNRLINKVSQDGISIEYASAPVAADGQSGRISQRAQMLATARDLRKRSKPRTTLMHPKEDNPWSMREYDDGCDVIIDVIP